jgi:hypothetical protein
MNEQVVECLHDVVVVFVLFGCGGVGFGVWLAVAGWCAMVCFVR